MKQTSAPTVYSHMLILDKKKKIYNTLCSERVSFNVPLVDMSLKETERKSILWFTVSCDMHFSSLLNQSLKTNIAGVICSAN